MGMTIDNLVLLAKGLECMGDTEHAEDIRQAIDTMRKYQMMQADYNARLKADMVAMLNDLADEISSLTMDNDPLDIADYIREKINTLKENTDGMEWQEKML